MKGGITLMICDRCGRGFRSDDMLKHVDPDTGKVTYICEKCWRGEDIRGQMRNDKMGDGAQ